MNRKHATRTTAFLGVILLAAAASQALGAAGALDTTFGSGGKLTTDITLSSTELATRTVAQSDGKLVSAGIANNHFVVTRQNTDGTRDTSFGTNGMVTTNFGFVSDGANGVLVQSDGKIVAVGYVCYSDSLGTCDFALARYTSSGALDTTFGTGGKVTTDVATYWDYANAVVQQADSKLVVAGYGNFSGANYSFVLIRYNTDGSLDSTFGSGGKVTTDISTGNSFDEATALLLQADGKLVAGGYAWGGSNYDFALARYNSNGSLDTTFGTGGRC